MSMDAPTEQFVIRWLIFYAGASVILICGLILMYLEKRDEKRRQQQTR